jgi:hypothetical protein
MTVPELIVSGRSRVFVSFNNFCIADASVLNPVPDFRGGNGLIYPYANGCDVLTSTHTGEVVVTVEVFDSARISDLQEASSWDEHVSVEVPSPTGQLYVESREGPLPDLPLLTPGGRGMQHLEYFRRSGTGSGSDHLEECLVRVWAMDPTR